MTDAEKIAALKAALRDPWRAYVMWECERPDGSTEVFHTREEADEMADEWSGFAPVCRVLVVRSVVIDTPEGA